MIPVIKQRALGKSLRLTIPRKLIVRFDDLIASYCFISDIYFKWEISKNFEILTNKINPNLS